MASIKYICISIVIFVCSVFHFGESAETEKPLVDYLTLDYLSFEQDLWKKLQDNDDKTTLFWLIREEHKRFFNHGFGSITDLPDVFLLDIYRLPATQNFFNNIMLVKVLYDNSSAMLESNNVHMDDIIRTFEHHTLRMAVKHSDDVFNDAIRPDFWEKGKNYLDYCRESQALPIAIESEFQLIYNYYKDIRVALLKTYIVTQISHMLISIKHKEAGNKIYQPALSFDAKDQFRQRIEAIQRNVKNLLDIATHDAWICDPQKKDNFGGYEELTNFLQGYIDNEVNFNNVDTCAKNCDDYTIARNIKCSENTMCTLEKVHREATICDGKIRDCTTIESGDIDICYSMNPMRRYDYARDSNGKIYGNESTVVGSCLTQIQAKSWRRWFVKCSTCFCLCDDPSHSHRHFSLHEVVSDVEQNKVVTGVRLVKVQGVIQFEISQRTLLPFGQTDASEGKTWKTADYQFAVTDKGPINGVDYFTLTYENRSINLDDLTVPSGKVVTGVRLHHLNGHVILQVRATDFDYFNGRLINTTYNPWVMNDKGGQNEIEITTRTNPFNSQDNDVYAPVASSNSFVEFGPTDFGSDLGQLTIPFIESFRLEPKNPVILSGVGLTYKNYDASSGGFIAPKIITYEFEVADPVREDEYDYIS